MTTITFVLYQKSEDKNDINQKKALNKGNSLVVQF